MAQKGSFRQILDLVAPITPTKSILPLEIRRFIARKIKIAKPSPQEEAERRKLDRMLHWRSSPDATYARLRAKLFPPQAKQPHALTELTRPNGIHELMTPLSEAMSTLARRKKKSVKGTRSVPVERILSHIWMHRRVALIFEKRNKGTTPPPVWLSRVYFKGRDFYLVDDGHHRSETARMLGQQRIRAKIIEDRHLVLTDWTIARKGLRHRKTGTILRVAPDILAAARWLGVEAEH